MCAPAAALAAASTALQIGQPVVGAFGQGKAFRSEREGAFIDFRRDTEDLNARAVETNQTTAEDILDSALQGAAERAEARARGIGTGLSGVTVSQLVQEQEFAQGRDDERIIRNESRQLRQIDRRKDEAGRRVLSRQRSTARPSALGTALQIGGAVADAASRRN